MGENTWPFQTILCSSAHIDTSSANFAVQNKHFKHHLALRGEKKKKSCLFNKQLSLGLQAAGDTVL